MQSFVTQEIQNNIIEQSDMNLSMLVLPTQESSWCMVGSWLPTYLICFFHQVERRCHSGIELPTTPFENGYLPTITS